ncbi:TspO/MBR family protein [Sphingomicrobium sp. XHP0239]|uniref:TspO/MBR family protein n=1 Tax=Sphingomicrobium maritimum TaxID=3133972 RepID=UPI0031CC99B2
MSEKPEWKAIGKFAIWLVPLIVVAGSLSGYFFRPDGWYEALDKPSFQPPGAAFGIVWPILYALQGLALAIILAHPPSRTRRTAIVLFVVQLLLNFAWSYVFFGARAIDIAQWHIVAILVLATLATRRFFGLSPLAGALMLPYLAWLIFAFSLNRAIVALNPDAAQPLFG